MFPTSNFARASAKPAAFAFAQQAQQPFYSDEHILEELLKVPGALSTPLSGPLLPFDDKLVFDCEFKPASVQAASLGASAAASSSAAAADASECLPSESLAFWLEFGQSANYALTAFEPASCSTAPPAPAPTSASISTVSSVADLTALSGMASPRRMSRDTVSCLPAPIPSSARKHARDSEDDDDFQASDEEDDDDDDDYDFDFGTHAAASRASTVSSVAATPLPSGAPSSVSPASAPATKPKRPPRKRRPLDEEEKIEKRRRNKIAAARCRDKKREKQSILDERTERMREENINLKQKVAQLEMEVSYLKNLVLAAKRLA
ncbi:hypothetical protein CAOG_07145 [Capsaspora owczarzaki ATCC 30864]|uniref:BZIP domain-containing protein n=1 Tax=Capsaspora owczarzaki (strain ATCC 30864) TaxID=595528 RepID=A0A0D2WWJ0_CAPO3|nr:hypothetical protein CAOG_07145 [Capsaspora owczarzaki ATCC 30864]KJE96893.1 hypothetical protein CAOG_007145 [Capsaspora owczarzaki ATCC 30864]|eukprot:XP_004343869.1 hypothetical protein CAOG_07145 [Capsaspora owczarzaki ATCC 30864]